MKCNVFGKKVLFAAAAVIMSAFVLASCSDGSDDDPLSFGPGPESVDNADQIENNTDPIDSLVTKDTVRVVDFRKVGTGNQASAAFDFANWDSVSGMQEPKGKYTADGLELDVKDSWDGAYKLGVNSIDLSEVKKVTVVYKVEEGFTYSDPKNNKMNVMFVSAENDSYKAIEVNMIDFAAETPSTTWKNETSENIYPKTWESCTAANMTSIKAIMLNTMSGVGKLTVMGIVLSK
ncbi:MAG: hypothetical protein PUJ70_03570 [Treponema sp.]|nr:hypothetical protein [Treponema sp.]MDY5837826.1 hypothetical protein [Treponema sp.]